MRGEFLAAARSLLGAGFRKLMKGLTPAAKETVMDKAATGDAQTTEQALTVESAISQLGGEDDSGDVAPAETTGTDGGEGSAADELQQADEDTDSTTDDDETETDAGDGEKSEAADETKKPSRGDKRFAELSAKLHAKDEALASRETEVAELKKQVAAVDAGAVAGLALPTSYVSAEEIKLIQSANAGQEREMFLNEAMARIDGEAVVDPRTGKELTKLEIARELNTFIPKRGAFAKAQAVYEERKSQFLADAAAGKAAREAKAKAPVVKPLGTKLAPAAVKPKVVVAPPAAAGSKAVVSGTKKAGMTTRQFTELATTHGVMEAAAMALAD